MEALRAAGTVGVVSSDVAKITKRDLDNVSNHLSSGARQGLIGWHTEPLGRVTNRRRYWLMEFFPKKWKAPKLVSVLVQTQGVGWRKPLPNARPSTGTPVITVCPAPRWDSRYQIDPNERIVGGFVSLGIGRYLDE